MEKKKYYPNVKFRPDAIRAAFDNLQSAENGEITFSGMSIDFGSEDWSHDTDEEFFADCRKECERFYYRKEAEQYKLAINFIYSRSEVSVSATARSQIEAVFEILEAYVSVSLIPEPPKSTERPTVFIGHGQSSQWRDLKDHLHEKHKIQVEAYEIGARAGHAIRDILEDMLRKSSFALLVLTAEDQTATGDMRARQNVVHELGLFQGKLGFNRAIVLLEEGTEEFSNIHGIHQIRYGKNNIKETYGEVLATIGREFNNDVI